MGRAKAGYFKQSYTVEHGNVWYGKTLKMKATWKDDLKGQSKLRGWGCPTTENRAFELSIHYLVTASSRSWLHLAPTDSPSSNSSLTYLVHPLLNIGHRISRWPLALNSCYVYALILSTAPGPRKSRSNSSAQVRATLMCWRVTVPPLAKNLLCSVVGAPPTCSPSQCCTDPLFQCIKHNLPLPLDMSTSPKKQKPNRRVEANVRKSRQEVLPLGAKGNRYSRFVAIQIRALSSGLLFLPDHFYWPSIAKQPRGITKPPQGPIYRSVRLRHLCHELSRNTQHEHPYPSSTNNTAGKEACYPYLTMLWN